MAEAMMRPELIALDEAARHRVRRQIVRKGGYCDCCGATDFDVSDALFLGFLFLDEDDDAYMIALTCRNRECAKPRTGIILSEKDFLTGACVCCDGSAWRSPAGNR